MSLLGQGVVAIWNAVAPEGRDEFYEWHNREHMPERVGIPGFLRGRRYVAVGALDFFTLYEATSTAVLAGPHYLQRLNNPTPATRRVIPNFFRNMVRGVCQVRASVGAGEGGFLLALRFACVAGRDAELSDHITQALPGIVAMAEVLGAHLCVADVAASTIQTTERKSHGAAVPDWLVMIEGVSAAGVNAAADKMMEGLAQRGANAIERGLYQLEISLTS